jgi:predicted amidophosphoribosyltransferase
VLVCRPVTAPPTRPTLRHVLGELLAPTRCLACRARGPAPWCARCEAEVRPLPPGCPRCATPRGAAHACWPADAPIAATIAVADYQGPVSAAVVTAKVRGAHGAWAPLARRLAARVAAERPEVDVVTWVTTPPARIRARGLDHAEVLARGVGRSLERPTVRLLRADEGGPAGDRYTVRTRLPGTEVLLVDDVVTTGATAWRAAAALRAAGAGRVVLAVLARAGTHPLGLATRDRRG